MPGFPFFGEHGETVRGATTLDLGALADEVVDVTNLLELSEDERAQSFLRDGVACYERAEQAFDKAEVPNDFAEVTAAIGRGRYLLACARVCAEHGTVPDVVQPCFFDPRHGPATRHIVWSPPNGDPRTVPACSDDASLIEADVQPEPRRVAVNEHLIPYWDAPAYLVPWFSGYFESVPGCAAADLLAGLPLGEQFKDEVPDPDDLVVTRAEIRDRWLDGESRDDED